MTDTTNQPPDSQPPYMLLRAAMAALSAAQQAKDWDRVAEGYVMLVDLHEALTGQAYDPALEQPPGKDAQH